MAQAFRTLVKTIRSLLRWRNLVPFLALVCAALWQFRILVLDINEVILVILSLLAVDMLVERNALWEELIGELRRFSSRLVTRVAADSFFVTHRSKPRLEHLMESAERSIDVCGVTQQDMANAVSLLRAKVEQGCRLRFLAMDPEGESVTQMCKRYNLSDGDIGAMRQLIRLNLKRLAAILPSDDVSHCEIRVIDRRLPTGYFIVDRQANHGTMHVEILLLDKFRCPLFVLYKEGDRDWFDVFVRDFEQLWHQAYHWVPVTQ